MRVEQNKQVIYEYFACLDSLDVERLGGLLAEDFVWIVPVRAKALAQLNVPRGKELAVERIRTIFSGMTQKPTFEILSMTAEDDRVHVESAAVTHWNNGKAMDNQYHHAFVLRDGKIVKCTEYCDFLAVLEAHPMASEQVGSTAASE